MVDPASIAFQRQLIRDMAFTQEGGHIPQDRVVCDDPWTGKPMTIAELFDHHARCMLVIDEIERRFK